MQIADQSAEHLRSHIEAVVSQGASGWVLAASGAPVTVEAWANGRLIGKTIADDYRSDIVAAFPGYSRATRSGFFVAFDPKTFDDGTLTRVEIIACTPGHRSLIGTDLVLRTDALQERMRAAPSVVTGPFPREILTAVSALWPDSGHSHSDTTEKISVLLSMSGTRSLPIVTNYARYLRSCWSHFRFIDRHFPDTNDVAGSAKDFLCKTTSPHEMISIAHHLYVLRSFGVDGALAEFGCFKGCSSSMLSYACSLLGIKMHIFNSFEGLPPSASIHYQAGDFRGSFDDVRSNIERFGAIDAVTFHKGFFAETLATTPVPDLMALWMDVDLTSSARDVMPAVARLSPSGALFSHECIPDNFIDHVPRPATHENDDVVAPILETLNQRGLQPQGIFLHGNTGAFWDKDKGHEVLANDVLIKLIKAIDA